MKLKLQVVLIPVALAEMPTTSIACFKKFLHLTDPESSVGQVCDALIKRYNKLYPEADKLQIEGIQDNDRCDLDPDFAAEDVFVSGDVVRVLVDNLLPTYSRETSMILPDITTTGADESNASKRRADSTELNDSRLLKKSRTIWGIRQESPAEAAEKSVSGGSVPESASSKSPVLLPPPTQHQTPGSKIIPQKKPSPTSTSGRRITSGMLKLPADSADETSTSKENDQSKTPQAENQRQSPDHEEIDDGTDSDDLVSNRLLKLHKRGEKGQNDQGTQQSSATKLAPPPSVPTKTPSKKEPLNTLTPYHNNQQPPHPPAPASQTPSTNYPTALGAPPPSHPSQQAPPPHMMNQAPPKAPSNNYPRYAHTQPQLPPGVPDSNLNNLQSRLMHTGPQQPLPNNNQDLQQTRQPPFYGTYYSPYPPSQIPYGVPPHIPQPQIPSQARNSPVFYRWTPPANPPPGQPGQDGQSRPPAGQSPPQTVPSPAVVQSQGASQALTASPQGVAPAINQHIHVQSPSTLADLSTSSTRQFPITSPAEDQMMQASIKRKIDEKVDDAMKRQEYLKKQGVGRIREEERKEEERKAAEERRRQEEQRRMQEEMKKAEENRILKPAEELKRQAELLAQEQQWRDKEILMQKELKEREEFLKKKEELRQQEKRKEAILRKQDDLRRQAELQKRVEREQEAAIREQAHTAKVLQEKVNNSANLDANKKSNEGGPALHLFDVSKAVPSNATMRPASGLRGLTPTVAVLPRPDDLENNTNGSTAAQETSTNKDAGDEAQSNANQADDHDSASLSKGEIMSIFKNNMRVPNKINKKLAVSPPNNDAFMAQEEEQKRRIREENIARHAAELESRRRTATTVPQPTTRSLRSRVTIGGVPNFDTNLDNLEDEREKEKEKVKEKRANALPAPFNDFASKSKLSSIYVKMKKLDARLDKQNEELLPKKVKTEPSTPTLQRTEDVLETADDHNGQQSTLKKLQAAAEDESDENQSNEASEQDASPEQESEEEEEEESDEEEEDEEEMPDVEMRDAAAATSSSEDDASGAQESSSDSDEVASATPEVRAPIKANGKQKSRAISSVDATTGDVSKPRRGRPRKEVARTPAGTQARGSLRTRSAGPEVIDLDSSSDSSGSEENDVDVDDDDEDDAVAVAESDKEDDENESKSPLDAPEEKATEEATEDAAANKEDKSEKIVEEPNKTADDAEEIEDQDMDESQASDSHYSDAATLAPESEKNAGDEKRAGQEEEAEVDNNHEASEDIVEIRSKSGSVIPDVISDASESSASEEEKSEEEGPSTGVAEKSPIQDSAKSVTPVEVSGEEKKDNVASVAVNVSPDKTAAKSPLKPSQEAESTTELSAKRKNLAERKGSQNAIKKPKLELMPEEKKESKAEVVISSSESSESESESSSGSSSSSSSSESESEAEDKAEAEVSKVAPPAKVPNDTPGSNNDSGIDTKPRRVKRVLSSDLDSSSSSDNASDEKPASKPVPKPDSKSDSDSDSSSDSGSSSSDESDSLSESEDEPKTKKKLPALAKTALQRVPSLVSSRMVNKKFGSLAKPTAKPIKAVSPPAPRLSEGVRTISVETPFSKSSDEDGKTKSKPSSPPKPTPRVALPKLTSLSDLQKRGVPDVRDSKDKNNTEPKKPAPKEAESSESELDSLGSDSDSDSDLSDESSSDDEESNFASVKKLSGDSEGEKKNKKKKKGFQFTSLVRDSNKK